MKINEELVLTLIKNNLSISIAESFTGGLASSKIVDIDDLICIDIENDTWAHKDMIGD